MRSRVHQRSARSTTYKTAIYVQAIAMGSAFADLRNKATCMIAVIGVCKMRSVALRQTQNAPAADMERYLIVTCFQVL